MAAAGPVVQFSEREAATALASLVIASGLPTDLALGIVRATRHQRGVQVAPVCISLALAFVVSQTDRLAANNPRTRLRMRLLILGASCVLPALGIIPERTVIARSLNPIWAIPVVGTARGALVVIAAFRFLRATKGNPAAKEASSQRSEK